MECYIATILQECESPHTINQLQISPQATTFCTHPPATWKTENQRVP